MARFSVTILAAVVLASALSLACGHESPAVPSSVSPTGSACTAFTLAGVQETFGGNGGSASVTITGVPAGCAGTWSASSSASWVTVTVDLLVSGSGRVTYQVAANPGTERTGTLTVAGQSIVVKQQPAPVIVTPGQVTVNYSGSAQTWIVPAGVTTIDVDAYGAEGGFPPDLIRGFASPGGRVQTTLSVSPGQTLYVYVGGAGTSNAGGFNGGGAMENVYPSPMGGGGGASDVRIGGTGLENRVVVAGGGGGGGCSLRGCDGGRGGGLIAAGGIASGCPFGYPTPAGGGSQSAGGAGGSCAEGYFVSGGTSGSLGVGGTGGRGWSEGSYDAGGGGGGGYYGGGGGGAGGGGGGGSSYSAGTNTVHTPGVRSGDGLVVITIK